MLFRTQNFHARKGATVAISLLLALLFLPNVEQTAFGGEAAPNAKLGIKPVNQESNFFELTLSPGQSRTLSVELRNFGTKSIAARTFPADAYTIVNGGFGARLRSEPKSGTTLWMDYKQEVLQLAPQGSVTRSFTVSVPPGTAPGDYISSLVIENEEPIKGVAGSVAIDQVQRQAIAVAISVPGPRTPKLEFGGAKHSFVGNKSVVAVALENAGNVRLRPRGRLTIRDGSGKTVHQGPVAMDSFYARTSTSLEAPLQDPLEPGRYTATLELQDDEHGLEEESRRLPFEVSGSPLAEGSGMQEEASGSTTSFMPWLIAGGAALVVLALVAGILLGRRQRSGSAG